jgi:tetratricopeptide (TPR) repeat protein
MRKKKKYTFLKIILIVIAAASLLVAVYFIPWVHERASWRLLNLWADIYYFFNPIAGSAFSPGQQSEMTDLAQTQTAQPPTPTPTLEPTFTPTIYSEPTFTPTPSPTPLPESVTLTGTTWEKETFNNCGPATLAVALSYWGWEGNQAITGAWLKPNWRDRNVMPYEMMDYVNQETDFTGLIRYGGDIETLKELIANGFPVIVEKGFEEEVPQDEWMGHYGLLTAYDDAKRTFIIQDVYVGADYERSYDYVERHWRSFNYLYMVIYPPDRESEVLAILGPQADPTFNYQYAQQKALDEIAVLSGRELFFAWYNYGTSLYLQNDYYGAANAYDNAFAIKNDLWPSDGTTTTSVNDPWRIMWYETGPYFAYYYTGRYQDVIDLADETFRDSIQDAIEESWVWRGRAEVQLGDIDDAIKDFRAALEWHPGWYVAEAELEALGVSP